VRLSDFASQSRYLNWNESDTYNIGLSGTFHEFCELEPIRSDKFDSEQFEIPIIIVEGKTIVESTLATKSKVLLNELINFWAEQESLIIRVHKKGSGFYTKYTVKSTNSIYDKASGKIRKEPPKSK